MEMSEAINELAAALAKAQGQITGAAKDSSNPFFKSKYVDLESVWDACRQPLSANGLSLLQSPTTDTTGETLRVSVTTLLLHSSGQWIKDTLSVAAKEDSPQALGSCITYLKRYAVQSFAGVAPTDDDDAEAAQGRSGPQARTTTGAPSAQRPVPVAATPKGFSEWLDDLRAVADEGTEPLVAAWNRSPLELRRHLMQTQPAVWESLKATAANVAAKTKAGA